MRSCRNGTLPRLFSVNVIAAAARDRSFPVRVLGAYAAALRAAVLALKNGRRDVARELAARLALFVVPNAILVPVPTTAARKRERGFNGMVLVGELVV